MKARLSKCILGRNKLCKSVTCRRTHTSTHRNCRTQSNALNRSLHTLRTWVKCNDTCCLLRYMCVDLNADPGVCALCWDWFARGRTLNFTTVASLSMHYSQWRNEQSWIKNDRHAADIRREVQKTERKKGKEKCRNTGQEIKTERWKKESGTEREAEREGWIEIGVSKRWCIEERVMRVSWLLSQLQ